MFVSIIAIIAKAFLGNQVTVGSCNYFFKTQSNQNPNILTIFKTYRERTVLNVAKVTFARDIYLTLWSLAFVIPGIYKSYEYATIDYILAVNPTIDRKHAFDLSRRIMAGHKLELLELRISFLGWIILSTFTCGILNIVYVNPYMRLAEAEFFIYVRESAIIDGAISLNEFPSVNEQFNDPAQYYSQPPQPYQNAQQPHQNPQQPYEQTTNSQQQYYRNFENTMGKFNSPKNKQDQNNQDN